MRPVKGCAAHVPKHRHVFHAFVGIDRALAICVGVSSFLQPNCAPAPPRFFHPGLCACHYQAALKLSQHMDDLPHSARPVGVVVSMVSARELNFTPPARRSPSMSSDAVIFGAPSAFIVSGLRLADIAVSVMYLRYPEAEAL